MSYNVELAKIDFKNGSSGKTPLNRTNLNQMQQNTQNALNTLSDFASEGDAQIGLTVQKLQKDTTENINDLLQVKNFIENSMKTLSAEGTSIHVNDSADYPCSLRVEGKSEQVQTEQSANLCPNVDSDKWVLSGGAYKENGYIVLPQKGDKAEMDVEWNGQVAEDDGFFKCYWGANMVTEDTENGKYLVETIYLNENKEVITSNGNGTLIGGNDVWKNHYFAYSADTTYGQAIRDAKYIRYRITYGSTNTASYKFKNPLISKTSSSTYVEFIPDSPSPDYPSQIENVSGDLEIKVVAKNLMPSDLEKYTYNNGTYGFFKISGQARDLIMSLTEKNADIDLSGCSFGFTGNGINAEEGFRWLVSNGVVYSNGKINNSRTLGEMMYVSVWPNNQLTLEKIFNRFNIQVEEGDTATEYEPYKEQTVTFPLGEQKLMKDGYLGDDGIHNKRKQIVLTGNEGWIISPIQDTNYGTRFDTNIPGAKPTINYIALSNFFKHNEVNKGGIWVNTGTPLQVRIQTPNFNTVEELKTWLAEQYSAGTPVIVEYEMQEEETTVYTSTQQTAYNNLQKLKTYRTVTNITNNQNTNMQLTYKMDLQTQIAGGGSSA